MFEEDLDVYFVDFGEQCTGAKGNFEGIFNPEFFEFEGVDDDRMIVTCKTSEVKDYRRRDTFTRAGTVYTVKAVQPDGPITNLVVY